MGRLFGGSEIAHDRLRYPRCRDSDQLASATEVRRLVSKMERLSLYVFQPAACGTAPTIDRLKRTPT